jgi:Tol biopolymer transport system component
MKQNTKTIINLLIALCLIVTALYQPKQAAHAYTTTGSLEMVSFDTDGSESDGISTSGTLSGNGRYLAFTSNATNLVPGDSNSADDVFLLDLQTNEMELVSVSTDGVTAGNLASSGPSITSDGRFIVFQSNATNLVENDTNNKTDIFVRDMVNKTTVRASLGNAGEEANNTSMIASISDDGRYVAFYTSATNLIANDTNMFSDIFVRDLQENTTICVSVRSDGSQISSGHYAPRISGNGQVVSFYSSGTDLVENDTNGKADVFVHNIVTGVTSRVSVGTGNVEGNNSSNTSSISYDGRYIAFESTASNLVADDLNSMADVFLHDTTTGETILVSKHTNGTQATAASSNSTMSSDGKYIVYKNSSDTLVDNDLNGFADMFMYNTETGQTTRVSLGNGGNESNGNSSGGFRPSISTDGNLVVFDSLATNLVAGDTNNKSDVFIHNSQTGVTLIASKSLAGLTAGNGNSNSSSLSGNGQLVAFESMATNLVAGDTNGLTDIFVRDMNAGTTVRVSVDSNGFESNDESYSPSISSGGRYVAFHSSATNLIPNDTNFYPDVFVHDLQTGTTEIVSIHTNGTMGNGSSSNSSISSTGRYVVFTSAATNLVENDTNNVVDVFLRDRDLGTTEMISFTPSGETFSNASSNPTISSDGNLIAFSVSNQVYVRNRSEGVTTLVSKSTSGSQSNGESYSPSISDDGQFIVYHSDASNLVDNDTNLDADIFIHDVETGFTTLISRSQDGVQGNSGSYRPKISTDGRFVSFISQANNLVAGDSNGTNDVFIWDLIDRSITLVSVGEMGQQADIPMSANIDIADDGSYVSFSVAASTPGVLNEHAEANINQVYRSTITRSSSPQSEVEFNEVPNLGFENSQYTFKEAETASITTTIPNPLVDDVYSSIKTVDNTAIAGQDYNNINELLHFQAGELTKSVTIPIVNDLEKNGNRALAVTLSAPIGVALRHEQVTVTIEDDETTLGFNGLVNPVDNAINIDYQLGTGGFSVSITGVNDQAQVMLDTLAEPVVPLPDELNIGAANFEIKMVDPVAKSDLTFTSADVCFPYDEAQPTSIGIEESDLKLMHFDGVEWVDITSSIDTTANQICGTSTSFSPFSIVGQHVMGSYAMVTVTGAPLHVSDMAVNFDTIQLNGQAQTSAGSSSQAWEAYDPTGTGAGWHLAISANNFTSQEGREIPVGYLKMRILDENIVLVAGNTKPVSQVSSYTTLSTEPQTFMSATLETGMGTYTFNPEFSLDIPSSIYAGEYSGTFTVSIISGP